MPEKEKDRLGELANFNFPSLATSFEFNEIPQIALPPIHNPLLDHAQLNLASEFYKRLSTWIKDFDSSLDESHEVGVRLVSFGQAIVFHLTDMGYWNPSLISFKGLTEKSEPVDLIQHVSQISILLMKVPRLNPSKPKVGFRFGDESESKETA